ncbi:MAG: peptidylprolyl isomerase [Bacteroidales bacterium]
MATLEKIRNRAGVLVAVVIGLALFAFILGDILGSGPSLFTNTQFEIAEIAGKSISYENFQAKVDQLTEIYKLNTGETSVDAETHEGMQEQAWQLLLRESILEQEYDRLGIEVSSEEMFDMVQGANIHPYVRQLFSDPSTGSFNRSAVLQFLRSMNQDPSGQQRAYWLYVEREIAQERKQAKYNNLIRQGLYVNPVQARQAWEENNRRVDFEFIVQRFNTIHDSLVDVSRSEIRRYYRQNRNEFRQEASRDIEYIAFDINPSEADDQLARTWIENMQNEFSEVEEIRQFINLNSDVPFTGQNFSQDELSDSIAEFMFSAQPGDIYGPYFENNSYKLSRLVEINFVPDSIRARHILLQPDSELAYQNALNTSDSLLGVLRRGGSFEQLAMEFSDDMGSRFEGGNLGWFTEGMMVPEFSDASFAAERGSFFTVESQFGIHIVQVTDRSRETKKVQVATLAREVAPSSATYQRVYTRASQFAGMNDTYEKFSAAAAEEGLPIRMANNLQINDKQIPGLESAREVIRWAYDAREGAISPIFEIGDKFVIAALSEARSEGNQPLEDVQDQISETLLRQKKGEIIASQLQSMLDEGNDLEEVSGTLDTTIEQAENILFTSFSIPGAGIEPRVIATAVSLEENSLSQPVIGENGVYVLKINSVTIPEEIDIDQEKTRLANSKRARVNFEAFEALQELANIKDNRHKFF